MTITPALKFAAARLKAKKIDNPPLEAEILLSDILKKPLEFLLTHGEKPLSQSQITKYQRALERRLKGEPIAYLTGRKEFYGLNFRVNKNVLIPRPETELLVEEAIKLVTQSSPACPVGRQPATIIDIGTGSGCIIITLAKSIKNYQLRITDYKFIGVDISKFALNVASKNARSHNVDKKIKFLKGDLLKPILNSKFVINNSKFVILANLPYGWPAWKNNCSLETVGLKFEPAIALFTGKNGLELYEKLFKQIKELQTTGREPRDIRLLCEFDPRQTAKIKQLIKQKLPHAEFQIKKDRSGLNRLVILRISKNLRA